MGTLVTFDLQNGTLQGEAVRCTPEVEKDGICLEVGAAGGALRFPGPASSGSEWPEAAVLAVDVYHELPQTLPVQFLFGEKEGETVNSTNAAVLPGVRTRIFFPLTALNAETIFLPRTPGCLKTVVFGRPTTPERIAWFSIGVGTIAGAGACHFSGLRLLSEPEILVPQGKPVVDELGQWTARDWPGKTHGVAELHTRLQAADAAPETPLPDRTRFGGSQTIHFAATGYFRTEHDGRRWWLVDPDGGAFFSAGVDSIVPEAECYVAGNETLCEFLPSREGEYAEAWTAQERFAWSVANLIRVFGTQWREVWERMQRKRLVSWGFNTVANWANLGFARRSRLPYVVQLPDFPTTTHTVFRDFPDVFAPEYAASARRYAAQLEAYRDDPYLIGYFLRNEPQWCFGQFRIAEELLAHDPERAHGSRTALATHLAEAYGGDTARFAQAWGGLLDNFAAVENWLLRDPDQLTEQARADLSAFSRKMVDAYVRIPSTACRAADPHHLNLGMRWAWISSEDLLAGSDAFDVFSLNMYSMKPDADVIARAARASGKPVLIGEYHWGALDRGLPSTGLRAVASQADRGKAYRYYVEQGAALPDLVGAHYFQMNDQPVLGRRDGENFQIGIVDVCWQPYAEFVAAARETHARIYDVASGRVAPFDDAPVERTKVGF